MSEGGDGAHAHPPNKAQEPGLLLERCCDASARLSAAQAPPTPPHPQPYWLESMVGGAKSTVDRSKSHQNEICLFPPHSVFDFKKVEYNQNNIFFPGSSGFFFLFKGKHYKIGPKAHQE